MLINLDALTPKCFHEVNSFTLSCLIGGGIKKKKRPTPQAESVSATGSSPAGDVVQVTKKSNHHKKVRT